jgi:hypothetical protein
VMSASKNRSHQRDVVAELSDFAEVVDKILTNWNKEKERKK